MKSYDKSALPPGPWMDEPDRVEWMTPVGVVGLIVRSHVAYSLCGYIAVPPGHPWYGMAYEEIDCGGVHGGLTYGDMENEAIGVTQASEGLHPAVRKLGQQHWMIGFDCGHAFDMLPLIAGTPVDGSEYRTIAYVKAEVEKLAERAAEVAATDARETSALEVWRRARSED